MVDGALRLLKKKQFGSSSEQTKEQLDGQMSLLFNEAEVYAVPPETPKSTQVAAHTRKRSGSVKDVVPDRIPVEVIEYHLSEAERVCPQCGEVMREIGTEVRETLVFVPAKATLRQDVYYTYACKNCEKNDDKDDEKDDVTTPACCEDTEKTVCDSRQLRLARGPSHIS